ncbi:N-acetyltransferase family protein [Aerosakkonemataceae cyanobacterium BLCC-F50]|uniref:N-acetyltransferase family protein n=1 Tax=Floridaenema flaviceps BLCC-F50 TaxID=3153642 RepID=A0ABV4XP99_9CYAN
MNLRDAIESDLSIIVEIYNASIPARIAAGDVQPVTVESRLTWFREHTPNSRPVWVAEIDGVIVGWLSFQPFCYNRPAYRHTAELSIYISANHRGCGVGGFLLKTAIAKSPALGIKTLIGYIFAHNQPSLRLFEKMGFQQWGYLPGVGELDGIERDLVIVGLRLT